MQCHTLLTLEELEARIAPDIIITLDGSEFVFDTDVPGEFDFQSDGGTGHVEISEDGDVKVKIEFGSDDDHDDDVDDHDDDVDDEESEIELEVEAEPSA